MTKSFRLVSLGLLLALLLALLPGNTLAQANISCETDHIVQANDWLSKLAEKAYGDIFAYPAIVEATNAKAASDASYATIANPDLIELGWKLCLPAAAEAEAMLEQASEAAPAATEAAPAETEAAPTEAVVSFTLLQLNDVYELTPVSGGAEGGLARVATLRQQLLAQNPNTFMVLAGDLFSPSALGTARVDGERLAGRQMVDVMNQIGLDFMTFGNHEFDLAEAQFLQRLTESRFSWVSSNVFDTSGQSFPGVGLNHIFTVTGPDGTEVEVGLFGLTLASNPQAYVTYGDPFEAAAEQVQALQDQVDILIAITHLPVTEDRKLATQFPQIDLILGGHEHEHMAVQPGPGLAPIFKVDANARTAYIHDLTYDPATDELDIDSRLQPVTADLPDDPAAAQLIDGWVEAAFAGFEASGFQPNAVVTNAPEALDGLEASVRNRPTNLTQLIAQSMINITPDAELAIFNSGSIRIDDLIPPGPLTEYDVIRILPFGGSVLAVEMEGSLLKMVLDQGQANQGAGGYLQTANVSRSADNAAWLINATPLVEAQTYLVAINDFLLTGNEGGLAYLTPDNPALRVLEDYGDIRLATIAELKQQFGQP